MDSADLDDTDPGMLVATSRVGNRMELASGATLRLVSVAESTATLQVDDEPHVTIDVNRRCDLPGGSVLLVDVLSSDRARLAFEPADLIIRPTLPGLGVESRHRRSRTRRVVAAAAVAAILIAAVTGYARWRTTPFITEREAETLVAKAQLGDSKYGYNCDRDEGDISIPMEDMDFACYEKREDGSTCPPSNECPPIWIDIEDGRITDHASYAG